MRVVGGGCYNVVMAGVIRIRIVLGGNVTDAVEMEWIFHFIDSPGMHDILVGKDFLTSAGLMPGQVLSQWISPRKQKSGKAEQH